MNPGDETASRRLGPSAPSTLPQPPEDAARLAATAPTTDALPRAVAGYELLDGPLSGGMGDVFKARHLATGRVVALKMIRGDLLADGVLLDRFRAEAQAVAAIRHPHVVRMLEYGEHAGAPYFTLEYLPGGSLADRLRDGARLPPAEAAALVGKVASAVQAGHDLGIVHRDLKPGNILFDAAGEPKVTDFGLAKWAGFDLTKTGAALGTPRYMAPEQADGSGAVGPAADVWALGVILYECLTGVRAFGGATPGEVVANVLAARPPGFPPQDPPVPTALRQVCHGCVGRRPADRYPSAAALAAALSGFAARAGSTAETIDLPVGRSRRPSRWLDVVPLAVGVVGTLFVLGLLGAYRGPVRDPDAPPPAKAGLDPGPPPRRVLAAKSGPALALAFLGPEELAAGYEDGSVRIWDLGKGEVAKTLSPRPRGPVRSADVSAKGRYLVTSGDGSQVVVWRLDIFKEHLALPHPTSTTAATFGPPDRNLLATGDRAATVRVWNLDAQIPVELTGHTGTVNALAFGPDGGKLASAGSDGTARVWDLRGIDWQRREGPETAVVLGEHEGPVHGVAFGPDGSRVATAGWDGAVRVWDAATGKHRRTIKAHDGDAWAVSFGNDGRWVASAGQDAVRVWEVDTGREVFAYRSTGRAFLAVRFAKGGTTLAAAGRDGAVRVWELKK